MYAAGFLSSVPSQQWTEEKRRINRDPNQSFSYDQFKEFLKERQLPAHVRIGLLLTRIGNLRQRPNQSVPELIAYLNEQEYQFDPPFEDCVRWMFLHNALHPHIRRSLVEQVRGQDSRADLEQAATALETVLIPPEGIKVKKSGYAAPELTTAARTAPSRPVAKRHPTTRSTVGYAGNKRKQERRVPAPKTQPSKIQKVAAPGTPKAIAPAPRPPADLSTVECYNCHNKGHISKNCSQPKRGQGKVKGQ